METYTKEFKGLLFTIHIKHLRKSGTTIVYASHGQTLGVKRVRENYFGSLEALEYAVNEAIENCYKNI